MNILLVSPLPPPAGGIATWTVNYKNYCENNSIPLTIVNNALHGTRAKQINAERNLWDEMRRTAYVMRELHKQLQQKEISVMHINTSCSHFGILRDLLCVYQAKFKRIPFFVHCRCNVQDQLNGRISEWAFKVMVKHANKVLTLNRYSYEFSQKYAPGRVITVPNFIEERSIYDRNFFRDRIEQVVFVGHVQKEKGVYEIIEAANECPDMCFVLVGPVKGELAQVDIPENVQLLGNQDRDRVLSVLRQSDVFLFPSYTEGFANALTEAMAMGLPVVTTDVGANKEMIENDGGIIVPVGNSAAIVEALRELNEDKKLREKMARWNIKKVKSNYLQSAVMQRLLAIYEEALN